MNGRASCTTSSKVRTESPTSSASDANGSSQNAGGSNLAAIRASRAPVNTITALSAYYASQGELWLAYTARWSPGAVFSRLIDQPLAGQRALETMLTRLEGTEPPGDAALVLAGVAWTVVLMAVTYAIYRKRDL